MMDNIYTYLYIGKETIQHVPLLLDLLHVQHKEISKHICACC